MSSIHFAEQVSRDKSYWSGTLWQESKWYLYAHPLKLVGIVSPIEIAKGTERDVGASLDRRQGDCRHNRTKDRHPFSFSVNFLRHTSSILADPEFGFCFLRC